MGVRQSGKLEKGRTLSLFSNICSYIPLGGSFAVGQRDYSYQGIIAGFACLVSLSKRSKRGFGNRVSTMADCISLESNASTTYNTHFSPENLDERIRPVDIVQVLYYEAGYAAGFCYVP